MAISENFLTHEKKNIFLTFLKINKYQIEIER